MYRYLFSDRHIFKPYALETEDCDCILLSIYVSPPPQVAKICSVTSSDGIDWQREEVTGLGAGIEFDRHEIFNVDIVPIDSVHRMYNTGYWGRPRFESLTLRSYRNMREKVNKES